MKYEIACLWLMLTLLRCDATHNRSTICWIHIQKTSSWFGDFLYGLACPHLVNRIGASRVFLYDQLKNSSKRDHWDCNPIMCPISNKFGSHFPVVTASISGTLFRNPVDRLISAYLFMDGMMLPLGTPLINLGGNESWGARKNGQEIKKQLRNTTSPIHSYSMYPGISSCQSKMMLGMNCGSNFTYSEDMKRKAISKLHQLAFFGLTEEAEATQLLYLSMFFPNLKPFMNFNHNKYYRVNTRYDDSYKDNLIQELRYYNWTDPLDESLYYEAKKIFYSRCKLHNITTKYEYSPYINLISKYDYKSFHDTFHNNRHRNKFR